MSKFAITDSIQRYISHVQYISALQETRLSDLKGHSSFLVRSKIIHDGVPPILKEARHWFLTHVSCHADFDQKLSDEAQQTEQKIRANRLTKVTKGCRGKHKGNVSQRYGKPGGDTAVSPSRYRSTDGWFRPCSQERHPLLPHSKDQRDFEDHRLSTFDFTTCFPGNISISSVIKAETPSIRLSKPSGVTNASQNQTVIQLHRRRKAFLAGTKAWKVDYKRLSRWMTPHLQW